MRAQASSSATLNPVDDNTQTTGAIAADGQGDVAARVSTSRQVGNSGRGIAVCPTQEG
jgi:isoaspartyl peptidase/L-asparaginase-like protein (Ntn-hydrolase superfamily)